MDPFWVKNRCSVSPSIENLSCLRKSKMNKKPSNVLSNPVRNTSSTSKVHFNPFYHQSKYYNKKYDSEIQQKKNQIRPSTSTGKTIKKSNNIDNNNIKKIQRPSTSDSKLSSKTKSKCSYPRSFAKIHRRQKTQNQLEEKQWRDTHGKSIDSSLTDYQLEQLVKWFNMLDADGGGTIDIDELTGPLEILGHDYYFIINIE